MSKAVIQNKTSALRAMTVCIIVTVIVVICEILIWWRVGNSVILVDSIGGLASIIPMAFACFGIYYAKKTANTRMPYGYRRIETLATLLFSLGEAFFAALIAYNAYSSPTATSSVWSGGIVIILSIAMGILSELLFRYLWKAGKEDNSKIVLLYAVLNRSDVISVFIILCTGVVEIFAPTFVLFETIATILLAAILFAYGVKEFISSAKELIDANPSLALSNTIEKIAEENPHVIFISDQRIRSYGGAIAVSITVEMQPTLSIEAAYKIGLEIENQIKEQVKNVIEVSLKITPTGAYLARELGDIYSII